MISPRSIIPGWVIITLIFPNTFSFYIQLATLEKELKELKTKSSANDQQEQGESMLGGGFGSRLMLTQGTGMMNGGMMPQPTGFY